MEKMIWDSNAPSLLPQRIQNIFEPRRIIRRTSSTQEAALLNRRQW